MNVKQASKFIQQNINTDEPQVDANYLLSYLLQKSFTWLKTWPETLLDDQKIEQLKVLVDRRKKGEPIAYITGHKDFWSLQLETNHFTLIPRPETELLVETALEFLTVYESANILDLGTGTGAIALAIAIQRQEDQILATDFVEEAVELAKRNAISNQISNVKLIQSDWFSNIPAQKFELILSNPPYVQKDDPHLTQGDLIFEPRSALVSADDGLADIRLIVSQSMNYLLSGGQLMIEHGFEQGKAVRKIFSEENFVQIVTLTDLSGLERITLGEKQC